MSLARCNGKLCEHTEGLSPNHGTNSQTHGCQDTKKVSIFPSVLLCGGYPVHKGWGSCHMHTLRHVLTHSHKHLGTHVLTHAFVYLHILTSYILHTPNTFTHWIAHLCIHIYSDGYTYTSTLDTYALYSCKFMYTLMHTYTHALTDLHILTYIPRHHISIHICIHSHTFIYACSCIFVCMRLLVHIHALAYRCVYAHTHVHITHTEPHSIN